MIQEKEVCAEQLRLQTFDKKESKSVTMEFGATDESIVKCDCEEGVCKYGKSLR